MSAPPSTPDIPAPARAVLPALEPMSGTERLALSRAQLAGWLDQDREARSAAPGFGLEALAALPWVNRWRNHPLAVLALGAVARAWLRRSPEGTPPALQALVVGTAVSVLRRHPKTVLVSAVLTAATFLWVRWRQGARASTSNP